MNADGLLRALRSSAFVRIDLRFPLRDSVWDQ